MSDDLIDAIASAMDDGDFAPDEMIRYWIEKADKVAHRNLLGEASLYLVTDNPMPPRLRNWVSMALFRAAAGDDLTKQLGTHRGRGEKPLDARRMLRDLAFAMRVELEYRAKSISIPDACMNLEDGGVGLGARQLERLHSKYRSRFVDMTDPELAERVGMIADMK